MWFDKLVTDNIGWIARQSFKFYKNRPDADDLAQDTLLKVLQNRDKFDRHRDFKPWVLTIMINTYKTRQARRGRMPFLDVEDDEYDAMAPDTGDSITLFRDAIRALRRAAHISGSVECVLLYARGYSYDEISTIAGVNIGTVKSRIANGRRVIRRLMDR